MNKDRITDMMRKVKELAERGADGERENARRMLEKLKRIHGMSDADLEQQDIKTYFFPYKESLDQRLLGQIIYMVTGKIPCGCVGAGSGRKRKKLGVDCTEREKIEIETAFEFYKRAIDEELNRFMTAFVQVNNLYPENVQEGGRELDDAEMRRLIAMMQGMERHSNLKRLEEPA